MTASRPSLWLLAALVALSLTLSLGGLSAGSRILEIEGEIENDGGLSAGDLSGRLESTVHRLEPERSLPLDHAPSRRGTVGCGDERSVEGARPAGAADPSLPLYLYHCAFLR